MNNLPTNLCHLSLDLSYNYLGRKADNIKYLS